MSTRDENKYKDEGMKFQSVMLRLLVITRSLQGVDLNEVIGNTMKHKQVLFFGGETHQQTDKNE